MYESFFGLRERPFDLTPNPRFLVLTASHREALSNLDYGIASRKGITLLVGDAGTGKTTLIRTAIARQSALVHCVHLHNPALSRGEFVEMLATRFGLSLKAQVSKAALLNELEELLLARRVAGELSVLIVDEAQSLPLDLLEEIRLLANIETNDEKALSVVIAGQPEIAQRLNGQDLRQLKQRVALRCELRPLTLAECAGYIAGRIQVAGGTGPHVFTREAVSVIHARSRGIPRTISVIADNALLTAFAAGDRPVSAETVRDVCRDFDLMDPLPAIAPPAATTSVAPDAPPAPSALLVASAPAAAPVPATVEAAVPVKAAPAPERPRGRLLSVVEPAPEPVARPRNRLLSIVEAPAPAAPPVRLEPADEAADDGMPKRRRFGFLSLKRVL